MAITTSYKQYFPRKRKQLSEESYKMGMNYTNSPLPEGQAKVLINYDFMDNGMSLTPRVGLRTEHIACNDTFNFPKTAHPILGKQCFLQEGITDPIGQVISADTPNATHTAELPALLYKGDAYVGTIPADRLTPNPNTPDAYVDISSSKYLIKQLTTDPDDSHKAKCLFRAPSTVAGIHGMQLKTTDYTKILVGTFAYRDSFYYFKQIQNKTNPSDVSYGLYHTLYDENNNILTDERVAAYAPTAKEAVQWGYNMYRSTENPDPYNFHNQVVAADSIIDLQGLVPRDPVTNELLLTPLPGQTVKLVAYYLSPPSTNYTVKWEYRDAATPDWQTISGAPTTLAVTGTAPELAANFNIMTETLILRLTMTKSGDNVPTKVLTVGFDCKAETHGSTANVKPKTYSLHFARGMTYWDNRLVIYNIPEDPTILFMSDINNPGYFAYPNDVDLFDEPIVHAMPYLSDLLVFTTTKLYRLTKTPDNLSWTKQCIQSNLYIQDWDTHLIQQVKNMVFFKSGNYFYMVVPSANNLITNGLSIAPISKPIEFLLDHFKTRIQLLVQDLYNYETTRDLELVHYYNFLDYEDIYNVYVFETDTGLYLNVCLLYNTTLRAWHLHFYESEQLLWPFQQDATQKGTLMSGIWFNNASNPAQQYVGVQLLEFKHAMFKDFYIPQGLKVTMSAQPLYEDPTPKFLDMHFFKNYQLLDTGYRDHVVTLKKRYRELQFELSNISQETLKFYSEFIIDGSIRRDFYISTLVHNTDPESEDYGLLTIERSLTNPGYIAGATILADDVNDIGKWTLDISRFPEITTCKIRVPVSGKGYTAQFRMISYSEAQYQLLNNTWIYKDMNSR